MDGVWVVTAGDQYYPTARGGDIKGIFLSEDHAEALTRDLLESGSFDWVSCDWHELEA